MPERPTSLLSHHRRAWLALACLTVAACSPTFDWRDVRPAEGVHLLFPCKPTTETRPVPLDGSPRPMTMVACSAGGAMFALAFADAGDPGRAPAVVTALLKGQVDNLRAQASPMAPPKVPGLALPAQRFRLEGRMPDGSPVQQRLFYFQKGTQVYQAAVLGATLDDGAADAFFESIDLAR